MLAARRSPLAKVASERSEPLGSEDLCPVLDGRGADAELGAESRQKRGDVNGSRGSETLEGVAERRRVAQALSGEDGGRRGGEGRGGDGTAGSSIEQAA